MTVTSTRLHTLTNRIFCITALPALAIFSATGFGAIGSAQANTAIGTHPVSVVTDADTKQIKVACHPCRAVAGVRG